MIMKAVGDNVIVRCHSRQGTSEGGIHLLNPEEENEGPLTSVGPDVDTEGVLVGTVVGFSATGGTKFVVDGHEWVAMHKRHLLYVKE